MSDTVLLMGLPNVGKSVIFNRLTGLNVRSANYSGTTVEYSAGVVKLPSKDITLVDVPGTYSLHATNEAEKVAVSMLEGDDGKKNKGETHCGPGTGTDVATQKPSAVICVLDAGNLESSLYLLMQVIERKLPTLVVLNRIDLSKEKGYQIDTDALTEEFGAPVVLASAVHGVGMDELKGQLEALSSGWLEAVPKDKGPATWDKVEKINANIWKWDEGQEKTTRELLGELSTQPWPGLLFAFLVVAFTLLFIVGVGLGLRQQLLLPVFRGLLLPQLEVAVFGLTSEGLIRNILIGDYGLLNKGLEWPFALVMPYVISFYLALSMLEDSGYLPRLGVLLDGLLNKIGLQGSGLIPILLGYGCAIPAILGTRALSSYKERVIVTCMVCLAVPCIAQTGSFVALLSARSIPVMGAVFMLGFLMMVVVALTISKLLPGYLPDTLLEIPDLLVPRADVLMKKLWLRIKHFLMDGALPMAVAVGVAALLYETGAMLVFGNFVEPLVVGWLGLPSEAAVPLVLGVFRRELTVLPLLEMELTSLQLFVGATVGLFYVPCIAVVAIVLKEFGLRMALSVLLLTTFIAFVLGGTFNQMGSLWM